MAGSRAHMRVVKDGHLVDSPSCVVGAVCIYGNRHGHALRLMVAASGYTLRASVCRQSFWCCLAHVQHSHRCSFMGYTCTCVFSIASVHLGRLSPRLVRDGRCGIVRFHILACECRSSLCALACRRARCLRSVGRRRRWCIARVAQVCAVLVACSALCCRLAMAFSSLLRAAAAAVPFCQPQCSRVCGCGRALVWP